MTELIEHLYAEPAPREDLSKEQTQTENNEIY
jgi:hypothetical protein